MSEVLVIGHRNPDTDAITSAIGYAEFKRRTGMPEAVAARCGDTNERIDFVLRTFGVPPPRFVADVSPKVRDVMQTNVVSVPPGSTVAEALGTMDERNIRVLPVLDSQHNCRGLLSLFKLSKYFFPAPHRLYDSRRVLAGIRQLCETLGGTLLHGVRVEDEEDLILMVGAMSVESFAQRLAKYPRDRLLVVVGDRRDIQEHAIDNKARVLVISGSLPMDPDLQERARENGVSIILSPHDSATTATLCRTSIRVDHMIHEHFLSLRDEEPLAIARKLAAESSFQAFPVLDENHRTVGILTKSDFLKQVNRRLILVDHNELSQAVAGIEHVEIIEIIDHHRIGALTTPTPILFRNEPVGSTSTIVADCFFRYHVELEPAIAGLLLAGLVSDTLNLTSPTTTPRDSDILARLERIANVNAARFTEKLFASGSVLTTRPVEQAITVDCKEYTEADRIFSVAQIEEIGFDQFHRRKPEIIDALEDYRATRNYFFSALLVTDVVQQTSLLLVAGAQQFVDKIDYPEIEPGIFELEHVVSRKKQLLPFLLHCLQQVETPPKRP